MTAYCTIKDLPLSGLRVLNFSQFLAGPVCALRLADQKAEVIKIERPSGGDLCRALVTASQKLGNDSLLFHIIKRNKKSIAADLKTEEDMALARSLLCDIDVVLHNFRPGVMERLGFGYEDVQRLNESVIYGVVSGYGSEGPWREFPGQGLLVQARSGIAWLMDSVGQDPVPMSISITNITAGMHLAQGVLAALFRRSTQVRGALIEVSLLASAIDLQFEQFTSYLNAEPRQPDPGEINEANVHAAAPYGIYETSDGHTAIAMASIAKRRDLLSVERLAGLDDPAIVYTRHDEIKGILKDHLRGGCTSRWLALLEPASIWCAEVFDWPALEASGPLDVLDEIQTVDSDECRPFRTTTCPIRFDGHVLKQSAAAPRLGGEGDTEELAAGRVDTQLKKRG